MAQLEKRSTNRDYAFLLRMPRQLYAQIRAQAEKEGRSVTNFIVWVLTQYLAGQK